MKFMNKTFPEKLVSSSPAEVLEYHLMSLKDGELIPKDFRLSDIARKAIIKVIDEQWKKEYNVDIITASIFGFVTGYYMGRNQL